MWHWHMHSEKEKSCLYILWSLQNLLFLIKHFLKCLISNKYKDIIPCAHFWFSCIETRMQKVGNILLLISVSAVTSNTMTNVGINSNNGCYWILLRMPKLWLFIFYPVSKYLQNSVLVSGINLSGTKINLERIQMQPQAFCQIEILFRVSWRNCVTKHA